MTTTESTTAISPALSETQAISRYTNEGELESTLYALFMAGKSVAQAIIETQLPSTLVREIKHRYDTDVGPRAPAPGGATIAYGAAQPANFSGPRADRTICECGANQAQHEFGSGKCVLSCCRKFTLPEPTEST